MLEKWPSQWLSPTAGPWCAPPISGRRHNCHDSSHPPSGLDEAVILPNFTIFLTTDSGISPRANFSATWKNMCKHVAVLSSSTDVTRPSHSGKFHLGSNFCLLTITGSFSKVRMLVLLCCCCVVVVVLLLCCCVVALCCCAVVLLCGVLNPEP